MELGLYPIGDAEILRNKMYAEKNTTKSIREQKDEELKDEELKVQWACLE